MEETKQSTDVRLGRSLQEGAAANDPPIDLEPLAARLRQAGATECFLAGEVEAGRLLVEAATLAAARQRPRAAIFVSSRRITASQEIEWGVGPGALGESLTRLVEIFGTFDRLARFRFAASDMAIVVRAAQGLIDARERDGPARFYQREIETGLVVTYARPFMPSNEAGLGKRWWPKGDDRPLHDELIDLRNEYHAHMGHAPHRALTNTIAMLGEQGRPIFTEEWSELPPPRLRDIADLAERLRERFHAEAERLDIELFGPKT